MSTSAAATGAVRALVTGGSGDIGAAICRRLAAAGHFVYVHAFSNEATAVGVVEHIRSAGGQAEALSFDVTDATATRTAIERVLEAGPIQILVNNAGIHDDAVFPALRADQWQRVLDVTLSGFFNVTQPLTMPMLRTRWGRIVNISSITAQTGNRGQVNYGAAKGAINAATRSLALELASRGVTVNAVAPGIIAGAMSASAFPPEQIAAIVPAKRAGTPDEVASLVAYLVSSDAAYITGQVIAVSGGIP